MARIKFSALVDQINGSVGGTTFQRNAYGSTMKHKPVMVNPNTSRQQDSKNSFISQVKKWGELSALNREAWQTWAETYPVASRLNPDSYLNGFNYFCKYHQLIGDPSGSIALPNPGTFSGGVTSYSSDIVRDGASLKWQGNLNETGSNWIAFLYLTRQLPVGQAYVKNTPKYITAADGDTVWDLDITNLYEFIFGTVAAGGERLGMRIVAIASDRAQFVEFPTVVVEVQ